MRVTVDNNSAHAFTCQGFAVTVPREVKRSGRNLRPSRNTSGSELNRATAPFHALPCCMISFRCNNHHRIDDLHVLLEVNSSIRFIGAANWFPVANGGGMEGMGGITHRNVAVNGISMHVAEKGSGPVVLFLHGFPELWYSWRHQILALAARGYHAVAPDLRGFGDTDAPPSAASYTMLHVVGDIVALIDALGQDQVFVVGHDWGALVAWGLCTFRPDKVKALVNMSVPYRPRDPAHKPLATLRAAFGDDYYICRFQEPGRAEAEFAQCSTSLILQKFLTYRNSGPAVVPKEKGFGAAPETEIILPSWLTEDDINYYATKFEKSGFTGGLNYYRNLDANWELMAPWTGIQIKVPTKFILGDLDVTYHMPGTQDYIHKGGFKKDVTFLDDVVIMEGVGHFINQEKAHEISDMVYDFISKF